jgi:hypothetical protein
VLVVWTAPTLGAAGLHHVGHRLLDLGDSRKVARRASSLWAGFVAWSAIIVVSMTTSFLLLVIDPPPIDDSFSTFALGALDAWHGVVRPVLWIALAAYVYKLERAAHQE